MGGEKMFRGRASATERPRGNALDMQIQAEVRAAFACVSATH